MTFDNSYNPLNVRMADEKYQHTARRLRENQNVDGGARVAKYNCVAQVASLQHELLGAPGRILGVHEGHRRRDDPGPGQSETDGRRYSKEPEVRHQKRK